MGTDDIFEIVRVQPAGAASLFGLVSLLHPGLGAREWRAFVRENTRAGAHPCGIFALRDARSVPHAAFAFRVERPIGGEATLAISEIAMLRLPGTSLVDALLRFANRLAEELDLPRIAISLERSAAWPQDQDVFRRGGFALDRVMMLGRAAFRPAGDVPAPAPALVEPAFVLDQAAAPKKASSSHR